MASTLSGPRTPRPPPTGPLPALPVSKTRKYSDDASISESRRTSTASNIPPPSSKKTSIPSRAVTISGLPTPHKPTKASSTPAVPTLSGIPKTVRKTTSIGSFPLPPKRVARVSSLPPSPLSASTSSNEQNGPRARSSGYGLRPRASLPSRSSPNLAGSPSLLNGTGERAMISSGQVRQSASMLDLPSPPHSRSSSAEGSYSADGTAFEDAGEEGGRRGRSRHNDKTADSKDSSDGKDAKGNVIVSVRVRPDSATNDDSKTDGEWMVDDRRSLISYRGREGGDHRYDNVFSPHDHNSRVYDNAAKRLVRRVMEGYHGTVFAYGMTGTGKTYSMQGTANAPGVIPLAITDIFSYIRENPSREFLLRVSYLEIYNEKIYDLLSQSAPGQQQEEIKLREDSKRGVYATPLKEEIVQSPNQLLRVIARGDLARRTGSTQFNARSSRSHAVVQIVVESRERTAANHGAYFEKETRRTDKIMPGGVLVSTLSLIDLAGSERAAENKERRTEGAHINKSLLTLGTVIARLSGEDEKEDGTKSSDKKDGLKHLPYRDSKLTRLLQGALSGNSLVSILCTIQLSSAGTAAATASSHTGETLNTLKFASRAKNNIVSHAKRNESNLNPGDPNSRALLDRYRVEIQELRSQLDQQNKAKEEAEKQEEIEQDRKMEEELERQEQTRHEEQMLEMQLARTALKERISHLNRLILSSKSLGVNSGRFSSSSMPFDPRMSVYSVSQSEYGRPVSTARPDSTDSGMPNRDSAATLQVPFEEDNGQRMSTDGEGHASLSQQIRMLQADLSDKNRYIATLEKRLLQARRTSHSRVSMQFASRVGLPEDASLESLLRERDREIEELRATLDDQMRMVTALRSAARKREMLDKRKSHATATSDETARPQTSSGASDQVPELSSLPFQRRASSRASRHSFRPPNLSRSSHRSTPSTTSHSSSSAVNFSRTPLSPMVILSPGHSSNNSRESVDKDVVKVNRRKSVDEMTQLLDQMIQDKVESGHVVRGERGSLRIRHDTLTQQISDAVSATVIHEDPVPTAQSEGVEAGGAW
ncbi:hypothetical protein DOTSEDRAFT_180388 [Dothistroma septosporum NZE10]|uniref:Kinesin-like protein KIP2 n=1 Tax=Dothistroma septosporum (strain NZE10 / CBS 128990) TaxID=675120 RepID=M2YL67_DOTSN|nr:hypothetical protein DOTSEDRAFT_180388 [Dothistroma septosporum NZE10]